MRLNVDEKDVRHHSSFGEGWWRLQGPWKVLHTYNQIRVPFIRDGILSPGVAVRQKIESEPNVLTGVKILDVGCGAGILSEALAKLGAEVVAVDPSENLIEIARNHSAQQGELKITYFNELIQDHALANKEKYDVIVTSEVLEHVVDKKHFLKACVECLKPGGSIFVTTINKTTFSKYCTIFCAEFICGVLPRHTHTHDQFISPENVEEILEEFGCQTVLVRGFRHEFHIGMYRYQRNTRSQYGLHAVKRVKQIEK